MSSAASPTRTDASRRWYASGAAILALFLLLLLPNVLQGFQATDTDAFCHLACARWMAEHRTVLDREVFSFTREGTPWVNYTWLSQLFPWLAFEAGGLTGLFLGNVSTNSGTMVPGSENFHETGGCVNVHNAAGPQIPGD